MSIPGVHASDLVSDGKRMRLAWKPSDGDGLDNEELVERSMNTIKGHPTWKVFIGDIPLTIERGSKNEPPHFCYLDDYACHTVFTSKVYTATELSKFWPFDFNQHGFVKQGRKNRGRPVFLNKSCTDYLKLPMRAKKSLYTLSGAPDMTKYEPVRPKKQSRMEMEVEREMAEEIAAARACATQEVAEKTLIASSGASRIYSETVLRDHGSGDFLNQPSARPKASSIYPPRPAPLAPGTYIGGITTSRKKAIGNPGGNPAFPAYSPKPVAFPSRSASPSSYDRLMFKALGGAIKESPRCASTSLMKQRPTSDNDDGPPQKRLKRYDLVIPSGVDYINVDGANDDDGTENSHMEDAFEDEAYGTVSQDSGSLSLKEQLKQMQRENEAAGLHITSLDQKFTHVCEAFKLELAARSAQESACSELKIAFQRLSNSLHGHAEASMALSKEATGHIGSTIALCDGIGSILSAPGKYMLDAGLDELWSELQEAAFEENRNGRKNRIRPQIWNFA